MYFLIYSSYASADFDDADLKALLVQSREKNKELEISGMLLFLGWKFVQFLEGEERQVKLLYHKICQDKRHQSVVLLKEDHIDKRIFADWSMAFNSLSPEELALENGYKKINSSSALQVFKKLSEDM